MNGCKEHTGGDVSVELLHHAAVTETLHLHLLILQLLGDILGALTGHVDPGLAEEGTSSQDEGNVDHSVDGVSCNVSKTCGRGEVVHKSTNGVGLCSEASLDLTPASNQIDKNVYLKSENIIQVVS